MKNIKKNYQDVMNQLRHYAIMAQLRYHFSCFAWQCYSEHDIIIPSSVVGKSISYLGINESLTEYYFSYVKYQCKN